MKLIFYSQITAISKNGVVFPDNDPLVGSSLQKRWVDGYSKFRFPTFDHGSVTSPQEEPVSTSYDYLEQSIGFRDQHSLN